MDQCGRRNPVYRKHPEQEGEGKVQITGQLGDVMKESVQIALTLVKSMFPEEAEIFE